MANNIKCTLIRVNCVNNDPVDIKCGGPVYLGFDFYVDSNEVDDMLNYIKSELKNLGVPLINIELDKQIQLSEKKVWNKEKISECIEDESAYLISQAKRGYPATKRR